MQACRHRRCDRRREISRCSETAAVQARCARIRFRREAGTAQPGVRPHDQRLGCRCRPRAHRDPRRLAARRLDRHPEGPPGCGSWKRSGRGREAGGVAASRGRGTGRYRGDGRVRNGGGHETLAGSTRSRVRIPTPPPAALVAFVPRPSAFLASTDTTHHLPMLPHLVRRMSRDGPDQLRSGDITYVTVASGFVRGALGLDAWSRRRGAGAATRKPDNAG